ncbi:hypothetical protein IMY05_013G0025500 [Salix suchowensis]|nr:hypothetical protein IMY05_013G0025500 [Salix suchowensis]
MRGLDRSKKEEEKVRLGKIGDWKVTSGQEREDPDNRSSVALFFADVGKLKGKKMASQMLPINDRMRINWTSMMERYFIDLMLDQLHRETEWATPSTNKLGQIC